ncbi:YerC/YecD family TrpR-related protein [Syntrophomonas palmitatica]|uniref:YerC/YecD family TrpR-related protein n=1 Tax=Syntrophomonas palmitatica TaxID=402877 RepID=UPI0006D1E41F|nr:YerC/YecD family TrpR-related protein [Syntrophomonas palmitatica]
MTYNPNWRDEHSNLLVKALLSLENEDDAYRLLDDLCTVAEIQAMAQRLEVANLLTQNITYNAIAGQTGASTATISRVKRCVNYGADGYKRVLSRISGECKNEK